MEGVWHHEDEEFKVGAAGRGLAGSRPRFSFSEVKMLLREVRRNRYILLRKFNHGVSAEAKKQKWAEITDQINGLGENHREVRQIMKKWADLKCDGKRRMALLDAAEQVADSSAVRRKRKSLDSVEKMVHGILLMSPTGDAVSDVDEDEDDDAPDIKKAGGYPYLDADNSSLSLPGGVNLDFSPLSSPDKELSGDPFHSSEDDAEPSADHDDNSAPSYFAPPKPVQTYSRHDRAPSKEDRSPPSGAASSSWPSLLPSGEAGGDSSPERQRSPSPPPPSGGLAQLARHSVQQQRAGRQLLASVSRSLGTLARSLRALADGQREFVDQSLTLQRETLGVLKTFSAAALAALKDAKVDAKTDETAQR
ncbi:myb-related transcription factor, partner of profilin-like isoform X1 [Corythoichthys intestinalis]|uniref:myb-related transcription factor, partner of profilin-like isoform X1 n=1 Tax=Corythoichthys intestinalis TaxID=161448 RepID=UPI0025A4F92C|nr:myb-related transcription factor, partner of profilin-like isoform X1 [Corythoichthys intestinalis]